MKRFANRSAVEFDLERLREVGESDQRGADLHAVAPGGEVHARVAPRVAEGEEDPSRLLIWVGVGVALSGW